MSVDPQTMADQPQLVLAIFNDRSQAETAVRTLQDRGVARDHISVLLRHDDATVTPAELTAMEREADEVGADVAVGGAVGGLAGLLGGLALFSIPGLGPFLGTGVLVSTLGGAALGSVVGERWAHSHFGSFGVPEEQSGRYGAALAAGHVVLSVSARNADEVMRAREALMLHEAEHVEVYASR